MLETPDAEGIYISCGAWGRPPVIQSLEAEFGKPVILDKLNCNLVRPYRAKYQSFDTCVMGRLFLRLCKHKRL